MQIYALIPKRCSEEMKIQVEQSIVMLRKIYGNKPYLDIAIGWKNLDYP